MYESKTDPARKFGSAWRGRRFDDYHATPQPEVNSTSQEKGSSDADVAKAHSPVTNINFIHDHAGNKHKVTYTHEDGNTHETEHGSAKEAHDSAAKLALEAGGEDQARDVKKMDHKPQQSAKSEEENWEEFDTI